MDGHENIEEQEINASQPSTSGNTLEGKESINHTEGDKPKVSNNKNLKRKIERLKEKYEQRGIVYISRLPPRLVSSVPPPFFFFQISTWVSLISV